MVLVERRFNPSNARFGSNFEFHFLEDPNGAYSGLTFTTIKGGNRR